MQMSYEKVKQAKKTIIGTRQAVKAIRAGIVTEVIIAMDAEERFISRLWRKLTFTASWWRRLIPERNLEKHVVLRSAQRLLRLLNKSFCVLEAQRHCFLPKNEPPGCVVLNLNYERRTNRCLQLTNWSANHVNQKLRDLKHQHSEKAITALKSR